MTGQGQGRSLQPVPQTAKTEEKFQHWNETHGEDGSPRTGYRGLIGRLEELPRQRLKAFEELLEATMREMGVTFDIARSRPWGSRPWVCDLLPQVFASDEWRHIELAMTQRLRAFEMLLEDVHGAREILRSGTLPVQPVLGSAFRQRAAEGLPRPGGAFLHLSGASLCRLPDGRLAFKHHYFSNASGISYMVQNRRALSRVVPQSFGDLPIRSLAEAPTDILEALRSLSPRADPTVVLLSPGSTSAVHSEHGFLARRMGIPLVQGGDLIVINEAVYLKTVSGLERVEVIYSRVSDPWLDPLVFQRDSLLGVPGLVHCIRRGSVVVVNAIGSQLADDRALLAFAPTIIRYYLGERPLMPGLETYWLGDIDQRELVLGELHRFTVRPLYGEKILLGGDGQLPSESAVSVARKAIIENASAYVAQTQDCDALALTYHEGKPRARRQDHIVFALRKADGKYEVLPGALTRTTTDLSPYTANELGGASKDTWVEECESWIEEDRSPLRARADLRPSHLVGSRVAEAFYWIGRYLERAGSLANMIRVIESLELEELNPTERTLYKPVWNKILPPLENSAGVTRRTISSATGRHRLALDLAEPDSVVCAVLRASTNAESIQECLSLEAWAVLDALRRRFGRARYAKRAREAELAVLTRRVCLEVAARVPEFFGTAEATMIADGGWALCEIGQLLERAIITANALRSILMPGTVRGEFRSETGHEEEIRLSAFLRLLASRDVYRRVYQMRIEREPLLMLLWQNPVAPRSVARCLEVCASRLKLSSDLNSPATSRAVDNFEKLLGEVRACRWENLLAAGAEAAVRRSDELLEGLLGLHHIVSDSFLNHQILIDTESLLPNPAGDGAKGGFVGKGIR